MRGLGHRWQLVLFLAMIFVPCAILIVLSIRVIGQERELRDKRRADERRETINRVRQALLARLDSIQRNEIRTDLEPGTRYRHPEVVLVGWSAAERLVLPWETDRAAQRCRELISKGNFEAKIRECERSEFGPGPLQAAAHCYEQALAGARHPVQAAYVRLLWARVLDREGRRTQAAALFESLLDIGPEITDEDGIPLKLYAAQRLLPEGGQRKRVLDCVRSVLAARPWLPPLSCYLVSDIAERLARTAAAAPEDQQAAGELRREAAGRIRIIQQAEALANDFPRLGIAGGRKKPGPAWVPFGDEGWLVGAAPGSDGRAAVFVVRANEVFKPFEAAGTMISSAAHAQGEPLGDPFPSLRVVLNPAAAPAENGDLQRRLYYFALFLVVAATTFVAYLLWRDLKRDLQLAELRSQFVSSVSHELRTPLTSIRMFAETLQMRRSADPETQAEYLDTIVNEAERLSRLVDGVLQFAKSEQGKRVYHFRSMQPEEAVYAAARALDYPLSRQGFQLRMSVEEGVPRIKADRDALEQAILNLLANAMKYAGDTREIELGLTAANGDVVIRVRDQGIGIAPEEQTRIFEKFYRAPTRENQLIPGAGLGLALVSQIVKAHGGRIEVESAPGKGSTFSIRLPMESKHESHPGN